MSDLRRKLGRFLGELQRRRVLRVSAGYAVAAWVAVQVSAIVVPALHLPTTVHSVVVVAAIALFPVAIAAAWAFDVTPEGVELTRSLPDEDGVPAPDGADGAPPRDERLVHPRGRMRTGVALVLVTAVASTGLGWAAWETWIAGRAEARSDAGTPPTEEALDPRRVAALYFDDHSDDGELGHVARGLTEAVIHELSRVPGLEVLSRNAVKPFRTGDTSLERIVRELRAGSLVEGSVARASGGLQATVQLIDGQSLTHLMSETIDVTGEDPLALRDSIVHEASRQLRRRIGVEIRLEESRAGTSSPGAWDLQHRAKQLSEEATDLRLRGDEETAGALYRRADSLLRRAEEIDPAWVAPTILRGWIAGDIALLSGPSITAVRTEQLRRGIRLADRALDRRPGHGPALELRGTLRYRLSRTASGPEAEELSVRAEEDLRAAVAADPDRAAAWTTLAEVHRSRGEFSAARAALEKSREVDPFLENDGEQLQLLAQLALELEEYEEAQRLVREGRRQYPQAPFYPALQLNIYASPGAPVVSPDSAWEVVRQLEGQFQRKFPPARMQAAAALARAGLTDSALAVVGRARDALGDHHLGDYYEALVRLIVGQRDRTLELLSDYLEAARHRRSYIARESWWKPLRDDPRFRELVAER